MWLMYLREEWAADDGHQGAKDQHICLRSSNLRMCLPRQDEDEPYKVNDEWEQD